MLTFFPAFLPESVFKQKKNQYDFYEEASQLPSKERERKKVVTIRTLYLPNKIFTRVAIKRKAFMSILMLGESNPHTKNIPRQYASSHFEKKVKKHFHYDKA